MSLGKINALLWDTREVPGCIEKQSHTMSQESKKVETKFSNSPSRVCMQ